MNGKSYRILSMVLDRPIDHGDHGIRALSLAAILPNRLIFVNDEVQLPWLTV
ncbi:hypothetical protein DPMN_057308 [Dreissena polymorpha]|uniref:Uncharacterized protein n=1 Tax=Dreissena polymorpha TaxID=45954 RepID=A0A9D4BZS0_DREPO|nr:hypothetical protein DPMN_057308 [Dreissena polymorpha]